MINPGVKLYQDLQRVRNISPALRQALEYEARQVMAPKLEPEEWQEYLNFRLLLETPWKVPHFKVDKAFIEYCREIESKKPAPRQIVCKCHTCMTFYGVIRDMTKEERKIWKGKST